MTNEQQILANGKLMMEYVAAKREFATLRGELQGYMRASAKLIEDVAKQPASEYGSIKPDPQVMVDFEKVSGHLKQISALAVTLESMHADLRALGIDVDKAFMGPVR